MTYFFNYAVLLLDMFIQTSCPDLGRAMDGACHGFLPGYGFGLHPMTEGQRLALPLCGRRTCRSYPSFRTCHTLQLPQLPYLPHLPQEPQFPQLRNEFAKEFVKEFVKDCRFCAVKEFVKEFVKDFF